VLAEICKHKLRRALGKHEGLAGEERRALFAEYAQQALAALPLGSALKISEHQYSDGYALLAFYVALDDYEATKDMQSVVQAVALLMMIGKASTADPQLKLALARGFELLGHCAGLLQQAEDLKLRQIQYDSVAYAIWDHAVRFGAWPLLEDAWADARNFFHEGENTALEFQCTAYNNANFGQVREADGESCLS
jgi:hypothetical protein